MMKVFKQVKINISFLDAINQIPSQAKLLKNLCAIKTFYAQSFRITLASSILPTASTELANAYSPNTVIASSLGKEVHDPQAFYLHAALLHHAFAHCGKFPTVASRRGMNVQKRAFMAEQVSVILQHKTSIKYKDLGCLKIIVLIGQYKESFVRLRC